MTQFHCVTFALAFRDQETLASFDRYSWLFTGVNLLAISPAIPLIANVAPLAVDWLGIAGLAFLALQLRRWIRHYARGAATASSQSAASGA